MYFLSTMPDKNFNNKNNLLRIVTFNYSNFLLQCGQKEAPRFTLFPQKGQTL